MQTILLYTDILISHLKMQRIICLVQRKERTRLNMLGREEEKEEKKGKTVEGVIRYGQPANSGYLPRIWLDRVGENALVDIKHMKRTVMMIMIVMNVLWNLFINVYLMDPCCGNKICIIHLTPLYQNPWWEFFSISSRGICNIPHSDLSKPSSSAMGQTFAIIFDRAKYSDTLVNCPLEERKIYNNII